MKRVRTFFFRVGRLALVAATLSGVVARSAVGEALVLHKHGEFRVHLHVLGYGDLLTQAQESDVFGHSGATPMEPPARRVLPIAVVGTGLILIPPGENASFGAAVCENPHSNLFVAVLDPPQTPQHDRSFSIPSIWVAKSSAALILGGNHAFLV